MPSRYNRVLCVGAIVRRDNAVLLVRQSPGHALAGQWSIPWGYVDPDESPMDAAARETLEEAGVVASVEGLVGMQELPDPASTALVFQCCYESREPKPDCVETDAADFFTAEELKRLEGSVEPWCEWVVRRFLADELTIIPLNRSTPYEPLLGCL